MLLLILQLQLGGIIVGLFLLFIDKVQTEHRKKLSKSVTLKDPPEPRFGPYLKMIVGVLTVLFLLTVLIALPYHWRHHMCVIAAMFAVSLRGKIIASALALFSLAIDIGFEVKFGFDPEFKIDFTIGKPCDSIPKPYTDTGLPCMAFIKKSH